MNPVARPPGLETQLYYLPALWPWASYSNSLCLCFLICKTEIGASLSKVSAWIKHVSRGNRMMSACGQDSVFAIITNSSDSISNIYNWLQRNKHKRYKSSNPPERLRVRRMNFQAHSSRRLTMTPRPSLKITGLCEFSLSLEFCN